MEDGFSLIAFLSSSISIGVWYIDNGVSKHMKGVRDYLSRHKEGEMDFPIQMGNTMKFTPFWRGTICIQMDSGKNTGAIDVLHVWGLGLNPISVSTLQEKGYNVYFVGQKVYIKH